MQRINKLATILIVLTGIVLALIQYFYNRSLWLDEASLALNIIERGPKELLEPLNYGQVAPILLLQLVNGIVSILGPSEFGLRFLPLLAFLVSLLLFYKILRKLISNDLALIAGLSLFVFNQHLIFYSSEFKQYIIDVFVTLLLLFLVLKDDGKDRRKFVLIAVAGAFSIFLSNVSIIVFTMIFPMLLLKAWNNKDKAAYLRIFMAAAFLLIVFLVYYFLFIKDHPSRAYMLDYWTRAGGFIPSDLTDRATLTYLRLEFSNFFAHVGFQGHLLLKQLSPLTVIVTIVLITVFLIWSIKRRSYLIFLMMPILAHYTLSYLKLYPNATRLILYLFPLMMIMMTLGLQVVLNYLTRIKGASEFLVYFLVVTSGIATVMYKVPMGREE